MRTGYDKLNEEVTLIMSKDEAAYLHAFLGNFSSRDRKRYVHEALLSDSDTTFLSETFDVENFDNRLGQHSYYFSLDKALVDLRDATL